MSYTAKSGKSTSSRTTTLGYLRRALEFSRSILKEKRYRDEEERLYLVKDVESLEKKVREYEKKAGLKPSASPAKEAFSEEKSPPSPNSRTSR